MLRKKNQKAIIQIKKSYIIPHGNKQLHEILRFLLLYISNSCELSKIKINTIGRKTETELANEQTSLNKFYEALKPYGQMSSSNH